MGRPRASPRRGLGRGRPPATCSEALGSPWLRSSPSPSAAQAVKYALFPWPGGCVRGGKSGQQAAFCCQEVREGVSQNFLENLF